MGSLDYLQSDHHILLRSEDEYGVDDLIAYS